MAHDGFVELRDQSSRVGVPINSCVLTLILGSCGNFAAAQPWWDLAIQIGFNIPNREAQQQYVGHLHLSSCLRLSLECQMHDHNK